jgi:hypothetical protein
VRHNVVCSKYDAAQWALATLPSDWHALVRAALREYECAPEPTDAAALRDGWAPFVAYVGAKVALT